MNKKIEETLIKRQKSRIPFEIPGKIPIPNETKSVKLAKITDGIASKAENSKRSRAVKLLQVLCQEFKSKNPWSTPIERSKKGQT